MQKGAVNVAEIGTATCKSRMALTARDDARASEAGYRRCHGETGAGTPVPMKSVLEASVWKRRRVSEQRSQSLVVSDLTTG